MAIARVALCFSADAAASDQPAAASGSELDRALAIVLRQAGFTGRIEVTLERRIGHRLNPQLADARRLLWFDTLTGLNNDNTCVAGTLLARDALFVIDVVQAVVEGSHALSQAALQPCPFGGRDNARDQVERGDALDPRPLRRRR